MRQAGAPKAELVLADLSDLASVRRAAAEIASRHSRLHLLVNCAAVYRSQREVTPDGLEMMFATNHLGPFLLTHLLLDRLRADGSARILNHGAPTVRLDFGICREQTIPFLAGVRRQQDGEPAVYLRPGTPT
jgi:NAD(P)-dependent dehydrogenase (short-subunit alcohol dehydrogenase family)